jgi:hypothetical protein
VPDEAESEVTSNLTAEDVNAAFSGPAYLANQFIVARGPAGVRIAFCEQESPAATPRFRSAVVLSFGDGIALYRMLQEAVGEYEEALSQLEVEVAEDSEASDD